MLVAKTNTHSMLLLYAELHQVMQEMHMKGMLVEHHGCALYIARYIASDHFVLWHACMLSQRLHHVMKGMRVKGMLVQHKEVHCFADLRFNGH
jgi:hypothetical protein